MLYHEINDNLFNANDEYAFVHCVSEDCEMGQEIAAEFQRRYKLRSDVRINNKGVGTAYLYGYVGEEVRLIFNLITKERYFGKPNYLTLRRSLEDMRRQCRLSSIKKLAMPKIGSGLDKLKWERVREIIYETFEKEDIEILVCYL